MQSVFEAQLQLQKRYGFDLEAIGKIKDGKPANPEMLSKNLQMNILALASELEELNACFFNEDGEALVTDLVQWENGVVEIVDALHFATNLAILLGISANDITIANDTAIAAMNNLPAHHRINLIGKFTLQCFSTASRLLGSFSWKHWKASHRNFEFWAFEDLKTDIARLLSKLIGCAMCLGCTTETVVQRYHEKNKINHERIDRKY